MKHAEALAQVTASGEVHELIDVEMHGHPCRAYKNAPATLGELYASGISDECFIVYEDERYTFKEVHDRSAKIANIMVSQYGIKKGDRVAVAMRNYPEWAMTFSAITSIGAIAVAVNALWKTAELNYGMEDCGAKLMFADQERIDRCTPFHQESGLKLVAIRPTAELPSDIPNLAHLIANETSAEMPQVAIEPNDDATILYTSGSTGHPKGVVSSHRAIISALLSWEADAVARTAVSGDDLLEIDHQLAILVGVPLFHVAGLHSNYLGSYRSQRKTIFMYKWDVAKGAEIIEKEKVALFLAPASVTGDLVHYAQQSGSNLSTLLTVGGGGEPRAPDQVRKIATELGNTQPNTGWGMTETNAIGTSVVGDDYVRRASSSGMVAAVLDISVVNDAGKHLPARERGELLVRGGSMFRGYWNRPEANAVSFTGAWFHTGDEAYIDEEGFLFIVGRIKDLVIRGGENIGCGEVEAALLDHDNIIEACVYAVPDEKLGEELGATLYVDVDIEEGALREFLKPRLAHFKVPRYIHMQKDPLPRIASGKIDRITVRKEAGV